MNEEAATPKKKRRRRRRRRGGGQGENLQDQVKAHEAAADDNEPAEVTPRHSEMVQCALPIRFVPVLEWVAQLRGISVEECAGRLLCEVLGPMKSSHRAATSDVISKTARPGPEFERLNEAITPQK